MTDAGNDLARSVDVQPLHGELLLMVTHHAQEPVRIQVDGSNVAVLTAGHDHVVGDGNDAVDSVRVTRELVGVEAVLVLAEREEGE